MTVLARSLCVGIALTGLTSVVAMADPDTDSSLSTVVVTGQRIGTALEATTENGALGSKKLLDTPFSITVIDADDLNRRQANSVAQIFFNDPSISSSSPSATTNWWGAQIRGLDVRNYYVDGVPLLLYWGGEFPVESIERVEALKGLTGFMYGFGTPGGAISYESKKPTQEALTSLTVEYRDKGVFSGHLDSGGRVGTDERLGYRVNVAGEFGEAYNAADVNRSVASLALDYRITPDLEWFANTVYEDSDLQHEPIHIYWDMYSGDRLPTPTYDYEDFTVDGSFYRTETLVASTGLNWNIDDAWKATVTVGYASKEHQSNKMFGYVLNEAGDYEGAAYNFAGLLKNYFSQALLQGAFETGRIRHELVVGAGYQRSTTQWSNEWYWENDFNGNIYERQPFAVTRDLDFSLAPVSEDERQTAIFASDTLHFGDHWQALLGVRYTDYELIDLDRDPDADSGYDTDATSPTLALIFKPVGNVTVYGSYIEAMEGGTRVGPEYANAGELLGATVSKQYELGAKYEQARMTFTTAAFRVERAAQIDEFRDGSRYLTQDGMTLYDGVEAIANVGVTSNLIVGLGATYLDASIDKVSPDNQDLEGNVPAGAGEWQLVWHANYQVPAISGLNVFGSVRYFDDVYYDDANVVNIPNRTLANVGLQYQTSIAGHRTLFTGNINNLFNKKYWERNSIGEGINGALAMQVFW